MNRKEALKLLRSVGCSRQVIQHCLAVARKALEIAERVKANGHRVDLRSVELGALLHDIGRAVTHGISHGVEGGKILRERGLEEFVGFAERHLGAGIPAEEAEKLGLPRRDYLPTSLEEKIVTYADKLMAGSSEVPYEEARAQLKAALGEKHPALERLEALHREIAELQEG
ncbi:MAG: TIGR00295 family protein [Hadesarchaea archaeon]|nr:TIGR00295 family protein [Hadesarchaea archaeon]